MTALERVWGLKITGWAAAWPPGPARLCWSPVLPQPQLAIPMCMGAEPGPSQHGFSAGGCPTWGRMPVCPLALLCWSWLCPNVETSSGWVLWWGAGLGYTGRRAM